METQKKYFDWNEEWKKQYLGQKAKKTEKSFWNKSAPSFNVQTLRQKDKNDYSELFMKILNPDKKWDALDVGCGTGIISIPLAESLKSVTAIDFSEKMIEILDQQKKELGISNLNTITAGLEDDWNLAGIYPHDLVVASRSIITPNLRKALEKLNSFAKKRVCISTSAGDGPFDRRLFEASGKSFAPDPDYIFVVNILHEMGIYANVSFTYNPVNRLFKDFEEAFDVSEKIVGNMSIEESKKLKSWLKDNLMQQENGLYVISDSPPVKWAVIWWDKEK